LTKIQRIQAEIDRIKRLFKNIEEDKLSLMEGLIKRISFLQVTLEDLEADINNHGTIEEFSQTANIKYDRERPAAKMYNNLIKNYTTCTKQLIDMLPKKEAVQQDDLAKFIKR